MRVVYFITSYRGSSQIYRLVRLIRDLSPTSLIAIHHDIEKSQLDIDTLKSIPDTWIVPAVKNIIRGRFSCSTQIYFNIIDWLFANSVDFDWIVNISEVDYPVYPLRRIEYELETSGYDGFISYWDVFGEESPWSIEKAKKRYWHKYFKIPLISFKILDQLERRLGILRFTSLQLFGTYGPFIGLPVQVPFNDSYKCYGGEGWYTLSHNCIEYIRCFARDNPDIINYYRGTMVPDESIIQTILVNSGKFKLMNDDKRFIDYKVLTVVKTEK